MTQSMPIEAHAVLDESIREGVPGFYVLAATVVGGDQAVGLREALRGLVPRPSARFHLARGTASEEAGDVRPAGGPQRPSCRGRRIAA